jgi:hypothetical protein
MVVFFTQSQEGFGICEPCQDIGDKRLEVATQHQNPLNIHV